MIKFSCPKCGCMVFTMVRKHFMNVDFRHEGAIEGHPAISHMDDRFEYFLCYECREKVPTEQANEMLAEVL